MAAEHQLRGGHPGQQGDLRVPALDGQRRAEAQAVALLVVRDQLLREREAHAASTRLALLPEDADLAEEAQLLGRAPVVERLLGADVVELRAAADERAVHVHRRAFAGLVDVHRPHERRTNLLRQEARGALREHGRVQAHVDVRRVQSRAPLVRLDVHRSAGLDERGHVRDRVFHAIAVAATFEMEGLVEIHRRGRVECHERVDVSSASGRRGAAAAFSASASTSAGNWAGPSAGVVARRTPPGSPGYPR